ncbi:hypothetical protein IF2G_02233 [Cordyceps javanica]|nr:hypothetical protein IF2G_02233 [Cordyceps javanica]
MTVGSPTNGGGVGPEVAMLSNFPASRPCLAARPFQRVALPHVAPVQRLGNQYHRY